MPALVMIVDDQAIIRRMVREVFEAEKLEVFDAANGAEGVQKAQEVKPGLIILDLSMPVMNGLDAARELSFQSVIWPRKRRQSGHGPPGATAVIFVQKSSRTQGRISPVQSWVDVISAIKSKHPGFLFIAEAYWDLEWELQQRGFDFCYDKKLYDRLEHSTAENTRLHLCADLAYQGKLLRFIENHDEPRAAATFSPVKQRASALTTATLPGIRLFHEGQFEGRKVRPPVFLGRRPDEPMDEDLRGFYVKLLASVNRKAFREGQWSLCGRTGWPDNPSFQNLVAWSWMHDDERYLIAVNLSDCPVQAQVQVRWADASGKKWHLIDLLSGVTYERDGDAMRSPGLYVELTPWNYHFFQCLRTGKN